MDSQTLLPTMATVVFQKGPLVGQTFRVDKTVITFGRNSNNDIVIPDPKVSRNHARIVLYEGQWTIENLSQNSLITINQRLAEKGERYDNTTIGLGDDTTSRDRLFGEYVRFERLSDTNFRSYLFDALVDGSFRFIGKFNREWRQGFRIM